MAYDMVMGNCPFCNLNGHFDCEGLRTNLGILSPNIITTQHFNINNMICQLCYDKSCPIIKSSRLVYVSQKHDWCTYFQFQLMIWQTKTIKTIKDL